MNIAFLLLSILVSAHALPKPQEPSLDLIQDVFGTSTGERYGGVADNSQNVQDTVNDIVGDTGNSEKFVDNVPNDYVEPDNEHLRETATVEVLSDNEECASYTESLGYMCVPYYQCSNGTIITDGAGLIDIRNGFGALDAQDGKCPGFLDVCCKDPDFIPPPPQPQPYQASCGRRNENGLGGKMQKRSQGGTRFFIRYHRIYMSVGRSLYRQSVGWLVETRGFREDTSLMTRSKIRRMRRRSRTTRMTTRRPRRTTRRRTMTITKLSSVLPFWNHQLKPN